MTDKVINFKQAKKRAGYKNKESRAAENRRKFGLTKAEKQIDKFENRQFEKRLDNLKLDDN